MVNGGIFHELCFKRVFWGMAVMKYRACACPLDLFRPFASKFGQSRFWLKRGGGLAPAPSARRGLALEERVPDCLDAGVDELEY